MSPGNSAGRILFYLLLCSFVAVTMAQRSFPTQDGPLHLYYADVVAHLLRGDGAYGDYFTIKHWAPPYAFHAYLLIALNGLVSPFMVEKLLVSLYTIWFCLSFRYLVHSVNPENDLLPLMAFPYVHNKALYLGFFNFCFGVAGALLLAGYWLRNYDRLTWRRSAVFFLLLALLGLTHPVALFVALMFIGVHAGLLALSRFPHAGPLPWRPLAHVALAGALSAAWVFSFTQEGGYILMANPFRLGALIAMSPLAAFRQAPYRILLAAPAAAVTVLGIARLFSEGRSKVFNRDSALAITAAICVVLFAVAPFMVNHGGYFYERFPIFALAFLTAFAAGVSLGPRLERRLSAGLAALAFVCLSWQAAMKHQIIGNLAPLYDAPLAPARRMAVVIGAEPWMKWPGAPVNFDPYVWVGAHYLRRSKAVLLNSPWLDAPIAMLQPAAPHTCSFSDPYPMAECMLGKPSMPLPDLAVAVNEHRGAPDPIPIDLLARSLGLHRLPIKASYVSLYGKR
jgi:hypothetical protein